MSCAGFDVVGRSWSACASSSGGWRRTPRACRRTGVRTVSATVGDSEVPVNGPVRDSRATVDATAVKLAVSPHVCPAVRRDGEPCRSKILLEDGFCSAHSGLAAATPAERGRRGGLASGQARREQGKSVRTLLREKAEEEAETIWGVYHDGFSALTGDGDPDHRARLVSVEGVLAQAYGRPATTLQGDEDHPLTFRVRRDGPATPVARVRRDARRRSLDGEPPNLAPPPPRSPPRVGGC